MLPEFQLPQKGRLSDRVYQALKNEIIKMEIKPRQFITIGELTDKLNISRTPVREALLRLERENWITIIPNKGAIVNSASAKEISDIIELQVLLEGYVTQQAAYKIDDESIKRAEQILKEAENNLNNNRLVEFAECGDQFHMLLAETAGNQKLKEYLKNVTEEFERIEPFIEYSATVDLEKTLQQHKNILEYIKNGQAEEARKEMEYHMSWFKDKLIADLTKFEQYAVI